MPALSPITATLVLRRPEALGAAAIAATVALLLLLWAYRRVAMPPRARAAAFSFKLLAVLLLLLCWLEPQWQRTLPMEGVHSLAILLDDSRSMRLPELSGTPRTRGERLTALLNEGATTWRPKLETPFRVHTFRFGSQIQETPDRTALTFEQSPSSLGAALSHLRETLGPQAAGILLLSDGAATDLASLDPTGLPPVYALPIGSPLPSPDIALGTVSTTQSAFEDAPVTLNAEILARNLASNPTHPTPHARIRVHVEAVDPPPAPDSKTPLAETSLILSPGQNRALAQLQFAAPRPGPTFYRVHAECAEIPVASETSAENNHRLVCVNRAQGPHPILYVAGRPNWEFGPMRRALDADPELQLRALIRIAKREPKFAFKGRGGDSTNPLFRGFQAGENAELQRYDKPVIARVNVDNAQELAGGFPKTAEELFRFKAILLDDLEAEFFTPEQLRLIQRFVTERGGGLLMLGGMESFEGGGWKGTPVESVLPVWIGKESPSNAGPDPSAWRLTREGLLEPWMRRRKSEAEETVRLQSLPPLEVLNQPAGIKPAATLLATANAGASRQPAIVTQRAGLGRSAALLAGDLFHWGIGQPEHAADLAKFWRQIARWLVADSPNPVEISTVHAPAESELVWKIRVRDVQARPVEDATVEVRIQRLGEPEKSAVSLLADPAAEPGVYSVSYPATHEGAILARATAKNAEGTPLGEAVTGHVIEHLSAELASLDPNPDALRSLAHASGGGILAPNDLDSLAARLQKSPHLRTQIQTTPLWHTPWLLAAALLALAAEWILRRRNGAA